MASTPGPVSSTRASARYLNSPSPSRPTGVRCPPSRSTRARTVPSASRSTPRPVTVPAHPAPAAATRRRMPLTALGCAYVPAPPRGCRSRDAAGPRRSAPAPASAAAAGRRRRPTAGPPPSVRRRPGPVRCPSVVPATRSGSSAVPSTVVRQWGAGHRDRACRVPGRLDRRTPGIAQGGGRAGSAPPPVSRSPTIRSVGFGLDGEIEPDRTGRAVRRAADPEAAAALRVGPGPFGYVRLRVREHLGERGRRRPAGPVPRTPAARWTCRCRAAPAKSVSGPSGKTAPRCEAKAESRSSVTTGPAERARPGGGR